MESPEPGGLRRLPPLPGRRAGRSRRGLGAGAGVDAALDLAADLEEGRAVRRPQRPGPPLVPVERRHDHVGGVGPGRRRRRGDRHPGGQLRRAPPAGRPLRPRRPVAGVPPARRPDASVRGALRRRRPPCPAGRATARGSRPMLAADLAAFREPAARRMAEGPSALAGLAGRGIRAGAGRCRRPGGFVRGAGAVERDPAGRRGAGGGIAPPGGRLLHLPCPARPIGLRGGRPGGGGAARAAVRPGSRAGRRGPRLAGPAADRGVLDGRRHPPPARPRRLRRRRARRARPGRAAGAAVPARRGDGVDGAPAAGGQADAGRRPPLGQLAALPDGEGGVPGSPAVEGDEAGGPGRPARRADGPGVAPDRGRWCGSGRWTGRRRSRRPGSTRAGPSRCGSSRPRRRCAACTGG